MQPYHFIILGAALAIPLVSWGVRAHQARREARNTALQRLGFFPCPERKDWLEQTVTAIDNIPEYRHEVREPRKLSGAPEVYYYRATCHGHSDENVNFDEEVLFSLKRPSSAGLVLFVKPSVLKPGLATRMLTALATGPWDTQPADLEKIEVPPDLQNTNLFAALGPPGARVYDLIDPSALTSLLTVGDAGASSITCRDQWCRIASGGKPPLRLGDLLAQIRPLL